MTTDEWFEAPTGVIADCRRRLGVMDSRIRLLAGRRVAGPAFTVETVAGENGTIHRAVARAPAGSVLVIDAGGYEDRAVWGGILTIAAQRRGLKGAVIDGAVRDLAEIRDLGFPLFARAVSPAGPHKGWQGRIGTPVSCGRAVVSSGDSVIGDSDGVVIVPAGEVETIASAVQERLALEDAWRQRIVQGESTLEILDIPDSD